MLSLVGISNGVQDNDRYDPYQFVYGKSCHLLDELEHKAHCKIKEVNLDVDAVGINEGSKLAS
jgi:hypothetical protein